MFSSYTGKAPRFSFGHIGCESSFGFLDPFSALLQLKRLFIAIFIAFPISNSLLNEELEGGISQKVNIKEVSHMI